MEPVEDWRTAIASWQRGAVTPLLPHRRSLREWADSEKAGDELSVPRARVLASRLHLMMLEKDEALECLSPFVREEGGRISSDADKLKVLGVGTAAMLLKAEIHAAVANLCYRRFAYDSGGIEAVLCDRLLASRKIERVSALDRALVAAENSVWKARLHWGDSSATKRAEVDRILRRTVNDLGSLYKGELDERAGAVDLVLAIALDLWAGLDWARGKIPTARAKVYQALFLLSGGRATDRVRRAFCLFTASRIESAASRLDTAAELAREARKEFAALDHPYRARATNQEARCLTKAEDFAKAGELLEESLRLDEIHDEQERNFATAERDLTELWIVERTATTDPTLWSQCLDRCDSLQSRADSLPRRLQAEIGLHHGIALVRMSRFIDATPLLEKALSIAHKNGREKIATGCQLWLARCYHATQQHARFDTNWRSALRGAHINASPFLRAWREELEILTRGPVLLDLSATHAQALKQFWARYLSYHSSRALSPEEAFQSTDLPHSTFYARCAKYGVTPPWRPRTKRTPRLQQRSRRAK